MNAITKTLLTSTLLAAPALAAETITQPSPATHPAIAQSNAPLVIPDGTSPQNPGPGVNPGTPQWGGFEFNGNPMPTTGVRG